MLIPKTPKEIWLNRVRTWLPPLFVVVGLALRQPVWRWWVWSVPLVLAGESLRTWAAGHLIKDTSLTVGGPYAFLRNPLYLGSLLSGVGFLLLLGDWRLAAAFALVSLAVYLPTVKQEEGYLRRMHGEAFDIYRRAVPALLPRLRPVRLDSPGLRQSHFGWSWVIQNKEHKTWVALVLLFALMALRARV
jgi:protein-S-isoprenylcysteine O-methyltransferase Ste14